MEAARFRIRGAIMGKAQENHPTETIRKTSAGTTPRSRRFPSMIPFIGAGSWLSFPNPQPWQPSARTPFHIRAIAQAAALRNRESLVRWPAHSALSTAQRQGHIQEAALAQLDRRVLGLRPSSYNRAWQPRFRCGFRPIPQLAHRPRKARKLPALRPWTP
jgi:hypothetical protein